MVEACENEHVDVVEVLPTHVGDLDAFHVNENEGELNTTATPLSIASERGCLEGVKLFVDMGALVDARAGGYSGDTALMRACWAGRVKAAQFLLERGASVRSVNNQGATALLSACSFRMWIPEPIITLLVEHGADVNATDNGGKTVMHCVMFSYNTGSAVKLLLDYGADVTVKDSNGGTIYNYLQRNTHISTENRQELVALCKQYEEGNRRDNATTEPVLK